MSRFNTSTMLACVTVEDSIPSPVPYSQTFKTITYGCLIDLAAMPAASISASNVNRLLVHNPDELYQGKETEHYATIWKLTGANYRHISSYACVAVSRNKAKFQAYRPKEPSTAYAAFEFDWFDVSPTDLLFVRFQPNQITTTGGVQLPPYWYGAGPKMAGSRSAAVTDVRNGNLTLSDAMAIDARLDSQKVSVTVLGGFRGIIGDHSVSVDGAEAGGRHSIAIGSNARANHNGAFVWNEQDAEYTSAGPFTFAINPSGGVDGVFIGSKSLRQVINDQIPSLTGTYDLTNPQQATQALGEMIRALGGKAST